MKYILEKKAQVSSREYDYSKGAVIDQEAYDALCERHKVWFKKVEEEQKLESPDKGKKASADNSKNKAGKKATADSTAEDDASDEQLSEDEEKKA